TQEAQEAQEIRVFLVPLVLLVFCSLLAAFQCSFLFGPGSGKRIRESIVPFMAGMFEYRPDGLLPRNFCRPRPCPGGRIIDSELITDRVRCNAREALGEMHLLTGALESRSLRKVR